MTKIFIVEDTVAIREQLESFLTSYGYEVVATTQFDQIIDHIEREEPQLVLLDINLPIVDGYHVCRELRKQSNIPIIVVTSRDTEMDELMSINLGADDFVTKPYNTQILLARIESILRRTERTNMSDIIEYNGLQFNSASSSVTYDGKTDELTKNEMKILNYLLKHKGKIVSRSDLMDYLWSTDVFVDDNNLSVNVTRLRKKLEALGMPETIETRRGLGYILP